LGICPLYKIQFASMDFLMMKTVPYFLLGLLLIHFGCSSGSSSRSNSPVSSTATSTGDIRGELVRLAKARSDALVRKDAETLGRILADEFVYTNASGESFDKSNYLARYVQSPDMQWLAQDLDGVEVRLFGETAVLTCRVHDRAKFGTQTLDAYFQSTFVYLKTSAGWRCVAGHSSDIRQ
jgi:hypothetical protein